jgi:uncharacterized membrane protein YcaP (DUF421 family)
VPDWSAVFDPETPVLEIAARGTVTYFTLLFLLRLVSQRQSGGLAISDLLVLVLIADAAQNAMADDYRSVTDGMLLVATVVFWTFAVEWIGYHVPALDVLFKPNPTLLVENGRIREREMRKHMITQDELEAQLRLHGVASLDEVKSLHMEASGLMSVVRRGHGNVDEPEPPRGVR